MPILNVNIQKRPNYYIKELFRNNLLIIIIFIFQEVIFSTISSVILFHSMEIFASELINGDHTIKDILMSHDQEGIFIVILILLIISFFINTFLSFKSYIRSLPVPREHIHLRNRVRFYNPFYIDYIHV